MNARHPHAPATLRHLPGGMALLFGIAVIGAFGGIQHVVATDSNPGDTETTYPILGSCSGREEQDLYEVTRSMLGTPEAGPDVIDIWSSGYHAVVGGIVDEYMGAEREIDCLSERVEDLMPAGPLMLELAGKLPPWEDPAELAQLSSIDTGTVLLEFLRTYECALAERYFFLFGDVIKELQDVFSRNDAELGWRHVMEELAEQERKIREEISVARPALERALTFASGKDRLGALNMEAECFYRSTLDLRNGLGAAAEAAACFPRVQDVKDPLRDMR